MGLMDEPFRMGLDTSTRPLEAKPKKYNIDARHWISSHLAKLEQTGVIRRAGIWEPRRSNVVLVLAGQSG